MKIVNIMNFARSYEPRDREVEKKLATTTVEQMKLVNELSVDATFLLQYDVLVNDDFVRQIKTNLSENIELGFWYEVVEPLTSACDIAYESKNGWKWDWNIKPGFSMSYPKHQRELLIDEAMRKFKEVFGFYPRTVGSWIIDTYTVNHLAKNYDIDMICYCRDQINTDAYTLVGGYFNQAYYPSKNNMFTPAQSLSRQVNVPLFRLLGPDPIHNYDNEKYAGKEVSHGPYTMEVVLENGGKNPSIVDWYLKTYFENESLGFSYMQIGQENSFNMFDLITPLRVQIEKIKKMPGVKIQKMCDTGKDFKKNYTETPATSVCALDNWNSSDVQSVYYNCKNYTANLLRFENKVFIRSLYLFDERVNDIYNEKECTTFDAVYENLPIVDTVYQKGDSNGGVGIILDTNAESFKVEKTAQDTLKVFWKDKSISFTPDSININNCKLTFSFSAVNTTITAGYKQLLYNYKNNTYSLKAEGGTFSTQDNEIICNGKNIILTPAKS